jgi:hypothetical protein
MRGGTGKGKIQASALLGLLEGGVDKVLELGLGLETNEPREAIRKSHTTHAPQVSTRTTRDSAQATGRGATHLLMVSFL